VVKSNAYGHGIKSFVPLAERFGITHFSVFSSAEAWRVFHVKSSDTRLMIMGWITRDEVEWAIQNDIEFYVWRELKALPITTGSTGSLKSSEKPPGFWSQGGSSLCSGIQPARLLL